VIRVLGTIAVLSTIGVLGAAGLLVGCGSDDGPVRLTGVPTPTAAEAAACEALVAELPVSLGEGLDRRALDPSVPTAAAWGPAPSVLTCGAPGVATTYRADAMLSVVNEVGWFTEALDGSVRYSTPTRRPQVVVTLPDDVQAFEALVALSEPVLAHTSPTAP
jgi:hypothetical protein